MSVHGCVCVYVWGERERGDGKQNQEAYFFDHSILKLSSNVESEIQCYIYVISRSVTQNIFDL